MKGNRYSRIVAIGFLAEIVILLAVGVISYRNTTRLIAQWDLVRHARQVTLSAQELLGFLVDAETGARGFMITGADDFLEPYNSALLQIDSQIKKLRELTADSPRQQSRLDSLEPLIAERLELYRERIQLRKAKGFEAAQHVVLLRTGKELMDTMRSIVEQMKQEENDLLEPRETAARAGATAATVTLLAGTSVSVVFLLVIFGFLSREMSQRFRAEMEVRNARDHLEQRVVERTAQLEAANKELEAFTYSVSHDLRSPLRHVDGFSKILLEEFQPQLAPEAQRYLERIRNGTQQMGHLVDDLLNLARVGRRELTLQVSGLNSIVEEVLTDLKPETAERQIEWKVGKLPFVECDPALMKQVFANLLSNAVKFTRTRERALIEVGGMKQNGAPAVFVRDNGVGFNMKYADKLFGVFQRLHRAEDFEGTGVGLATVQRIIHKHSGHVWAEGELDKGATFYFSLGNAESIPSETSRVPRR